MAQPTIDFAEIYWYAIHANVAYQTDVEIKQALPQVTKIVTSQKQDVKFFIETIPESKTQLISFRGTSNLKNVLEDVQYIPIKNKELHTFVHRGFERDTKSIYNEVTQHLIKTYELCLTGHSLGAAIATLTMIYLYNDGYKIQRSINFGQPKITNHRGASAYNQLPLTRVVNQDDPVPLVPPITMLDSLHGVYEHLGDEVILMKGKQYQYFDAHNAERKSVGSFWKNLRHEKLDDHFMNNYLKNIESKLSEQ